MDKARHGRMSILDEVDHAAAYNPITKTRLVGAFTTAEDYLHEGLHDTINNMTDVAQLRNEAIEAGRAAPKEYADFVRKQLDKMVDGFDTTRFTWQAFVERALSAFGADTEQQAQTMAICAAWAADNMGENSQWADWFADEYWSYLGSYDADAAEHVYEVAGTRDGDEAAASDIRYATRPTNDALRRLADVVDQQGLGDTSVANTGDPMAFLRGRFPDMTDAELREMAESMRGENEPDFKAAPHFYSGDDVAVAVRELGLPEAKTRGLLRHPDDVQRAFVMLPDAKNPEAYDANVKEARNAVRYERYRVSVEAKRDAAIEQNAITMDDYNDILEDLGVRADLRTEQGKMLSEKQRAKLLAAIEGKQGEAIDELKAALREAKKLRPPLQDKVDSIRRALNVDGNSDAVLAKVRSLADYVAREWGLDPEHAAEQGAGMVDVHVPYSLLKMLENKLRQEKAVPARQLPAEIVQNITNIVRGLAHQSDTINKLIVRRRERKLAESVKRLFDTIVGRQNRYKKGSWKSYSPSAGAEAPRKSKILSWTMGAGLRSVQGLARRLAGEDSDLYRIFADDAQEAERAYWHLDQVRQEALKVQLGVLDVPQSEFYDWEGAPNYGRRGQGQPSELVNFPLTDSYQFESASDQSGRRVGSIDLTPLEAASIYLHMRDPSTRHELLRAAQRGFALKRKGAVMSAGSVRLSEADLKSIVRWVEGQPKLKAFVDFLMDYQAKIAFPAMNEVFVRRMGHDLVRDKNVPYWSRRRIEDYRKDRVPTLGQSLAWMLQDMGILQERSATNSPFVLEDALDTFNRVVNQMNAYTAKAEVVDNMVRLMRQPQMRQAIIGSTWNVGPALRYRGVDVLENFDEFIDDFQRAPGIRSTSKGSQGWTRELYNSHPFLLGLKLKTWLMMPVSSVYATVIVPRKIWANPKNSVLLRPLTEDEMSRVSAGPAFREILHGGIEQVISPLGTLRASNEAELYGSTSERGLGGAMAKTNKAAMDLLSKSNSLAVKQMYRWAKAWIESEGGSVEFGGERISDPVDLAERLWMRTQAFGEPVSMSQLQREARRGNGMMALLTLYQNEAFKAYELGVGAVEDWQMNKTPAAARKVVWAALVLMILPAIMRYWLDQLQWFLYSGGKVKPKSLVEHLRGMGGYMVGQIPVLGTVFQGAVEIMTARNRYASKEMRTWEHPLAQAAEDVSEAVLSLRLAVEDVMKGKTYESGQFAGDPKVIDDAANGLIGLLGASGAITQLLMGKPLPTQGVAQLLRSSYWGMRRRMRPQTPVTEDDTSEPSERPLWEIEEPLPEPPEPAGD
jgi:hypothetical protein